jgi:transitional endoplasmic reticulum ATPase
MPGFLRSEPSSASLFEQTGWYLRSRVDSVGRELDYLARRVKISSAAEKSAWWFRCVVSCALVAGECLIFSWLSFPINSLPTLVISWFVLFLLPKPTPRIPLFAGRWVALIALLFNLDVAFAAVGEVVPATRTWDGAFAMLWWVIAAVLVFWAFRALRSQGSNVASAQATASAVQAAEERWSNIPAVRFVDFGGSERAKQEVETIARNRFVENSAGVVRNGILLHGEHGTGKNLLAEATAGEFGVNFHHVRCPELMGVSIGSTSAEIRRVFEWAAAHRPIVLFLDEIDSIGSRKQPQGAGTDAGGGGREYNTVTTQLMQSIDQHRNLDGFLLMAATNYLDGLEPILIREGRFDAKLRLGLPGEEGRKEILDAQLARLAWRQHDLSNIARRTPGWSPARLRSLVDRATLLANGQPVEERHLIEALEGAGGQDGVPPEQIDWDDVVLPQPVIDDLKALIRLMELGAAERLSLPAPTGLILLGAAGMGKTMTAKLIAAQSKRSLYSLPPSEVLAGAVGGSVKRLREIFVRAKENAPSILFFDEMDGLFPRVQGPVVQHDVQLVEQALIEISSLKPEHNVFLIGTTNHLDRIDPRILRGGRFSEKIEIGIPDAAGYQRLLARYLGAARLADGLTPAIIIARVRGMSPADLEAAVNSMKRVAMRRMNSTETQLPPLQTEDLEEALGRVQPSC